MSQEGKKDLIKTVDYMTITVFVAVHQGKEIPTSSDYVGEASQTITLPINVGPGAINLNMIANSLGLTAYNDAIFKGLVEVTPPGIQQAPS